MDYTAHCIYKERRFTQNQMPFSLFKANNASKRIASMTGPFDLDQPLQFHRHPMIVFI